jgi:hypothetical protein
VAAFLEVHDKELHKWACVDEVGALKEAKEHKARAADDKCRRDTDMGAV